MSAEPSNTLPAHTHNNPAPIDSQCRGKWAAHRLGARVTDMDRYPTEICAEDIAGRASIRKPSKNNQIT